MKTDDLIDALAADLEPMPRYAMLQRLLVAAALGGAITFAIVTVGYGLREDLGAAIGRWDFSRKMLFTGAVAALGFSAALHASRPDARMRVRLALTLVPFVAIAALAAAELAQIDAPSLRVSAWLGLTWLTCPWSIMLLALPPMILLLRAVRRLAPARPMIAGLAVGLASGGLAATAYGLHCPEWSATFVATWYALGILGSGAIGALASRRWLRW